MAYANQVALKEIRHMDGDVQGGNHVQETKKDGTSTQNGISVISEQGENISNGAPKPMNDPAHVKGKRSPFHNFDAGFLLVVAFAVVVVVLNLYYHLRLSSICHVVSFHHTFFLSYCHSLQK